MRRSYDELKKFDTLNERFRYLALRGTVGEQTFGSERYLNQRFYTSRRWRQIRDFVITRDNGCDLGIDGFEIHGRIIIHHMNPLTLGDIVDGGNEIIDPRYLISTTHQSHNAIHYGNEELLPQYFVERRPGDTKLW